MKKAKHFEGGGGAEDQDERARARSASNFTDSAAAVQKLAPYSSGRGDDMEETPAPIYSPRLAPNTRLQRDFRDDDLHPDNKKPYQVGAGLASMGGFEPFEKFKARMDKYDADKAARDVRQISGDLPQEWDRAAAHVPTKFSPKPGEEEMASVEAMRRPAPSKVAKAKAIAPKFRASMGYASGGSVSASRRGDGIAQRGKTRGKMC